MYPKLFTALLAAAACQAAFAAPPDSPLKAAPVPGQDFTFPNRFDTEHQQQLERNSELRKKTAKPDGGYTRLPEMGDADLKNNLELTHHIINTAMIREDWPTLQRIMGFYREIPNHDPTMYGFVQGALLRSQGKHGKALKLYRNILEKQPDLSYVRLDYAGMLFENRAYRDAKKQFERVKKEDIEPEAAAQAEGYLMAVREMNPLQAKIRAGWQYSNNVNNATSNDYFLWPFMEDEHNVYYEILPREVTSMPRSGHGYSYGAEVQKDFNIKGSHNLSAGFNADGVHYPSSQSDNEFGLSLNPGYKFQNIDTTFEINPIIRADWQGNRLYSRNLGASAAVSRWISPKTQLAASYFGIKKKYHDESYAGYNSIMHGASATAFRALTDKLFVYGSAGWQNEKTEDSEESSNRRSAGLGMVYQAGNGTGIRTNARFVHRRFKNPASLYAGIRRRDREMYFDASVWKEKWLPGGITPKLEFSYTKVKSNIYAFARDKKQIAVTFEKAF